jgi:hypothetical protein
MIPYRLKRIKYRVCNPDTGLAWTVSGEAIDLPLPARVCVRWSILEQLYIADDYDSGCRIGPGSDDKEECIRVAVALLEKYIPTGRYFVVRDEAIATWHRNKNGRPDPAG